MTNEEKYKTPEERIGAFSKHCSRKDCCNCQAYKIPLYPDGRIGCVLRWLALEAEEKLLACPFCGGEAEVFSAMYAHRLNGARVRCTRCWAITPVYKDDSEALAAWNRRVK